MPSYAITPPFDETLFNSVVENIKPDPAVAAFIYRYLRNTEASRRYSRGMGPPPVLGPDLESSRPLADVRNEADALERAYSEAYYHAHPQARIA